MTDHTSKIAYFRLELDKATEITRESIQQLVTTGPFDLANADREEIIWQLEASFDITQDVGFSIKADYKPWLRARKPEIDFFYWQRLKRYYLEQDVLPPHVISTLDAVTDELLDYSGNPHVEQSWARRGMVMGQVQSGKTTNYASLICKAADSGYKVVILLAGITNTLRAQTQERLDETFIGKKSVFQTVGQEQLSIVNYSDRKRFPAYGTSRDQDFSKVAAGTYGVSLSALKEPLIFVTKKNKTTLERLRDWLMEQNQGHKIHDPLILIDDEADNASINTAADPDRVTAINKAIREILGLFSRSTYIGYTATPFANIFIDPASEHEMLNDDLFPRNFIKALDPPTNYAGATRVFAERGDLKSMVQLVDDYQDHLPLKHKKDAAFSVLPDSLYQAIRVFVIVRAVRVLRGDGKKHASMMINVSRFNDVQERVYGLVYKYLEDLKSSIVVNAGLGTRESRDLHMRQLRADFEREYSDVGFKFEEVLGCLNEAVASILPRTVNMKGGVLDYSQHKEDGLHVIAIGGLALSRGLTLEGLSVSYILRNASASDTLMQMARWFGFRPNYGDLCRLYLPEDSRDHYEYITEAIEELRSEVKRMEQQRLSPKNFGLRVRQSPAAIRVTAANKMRTATEMRIAGDYSGHHVEGYALKDDKGINERNMEAAKSFLRGLGEPGKIPDGDVLIWYAVEGFQVQALLKKFTFSAVHSDLGPIQGDRSLFWDYVADRIGTELKVWDVAVPTRGPEPGKEDGFEIIPGIRHRLRDRRTGDVRGDTYRVTKKNKAANPGDEQIGLDPEARQRAASSGQKGARAYCLERDRPLIMVHIFNVTHPPERKLGDEVVTLSFCLPDTNTDPVLRTYQVNTVYREQLREITAEPDDDEPMFEELANV